MVTILSIRVPYFAKNPEIIVATPGRLKEHIQRGTADFTDLEVLILDEADRMLDMGLQEDVTAIANACCPQRQTLLFSATLTDDTATACGEFAQLLNNPQRVQVGEPDQGNLNITQQFVLSDDEKHKNKASLQLLETTDYDKALVFCNTKAQVNKLVGWLKYQQLSVAVLHGDMDQEARTQELNRFRRGRCQILVASDVAARGLDIKGVDLVINYDFPPQP